MPSPPRSGFGGGALTGSEAKKSNGSSFLVSSGLDGTNALALVYIVGFGFESMIMSRLMSEASVFVSYTTHLPFFFFLLVSSVEMAPPSFTFLGAIGNGSESACLTCG